MRVQISPCIHILFTNSDGSDQPMYPHTLYKQWWFRSANVSTYTLQTVMVQISQCIHIHFTNSNGSDQPMYPHTLYKQWWFRSANVQVSPIITRWSGCISPDRDIGEARSKFGADWSDFINVDICTGHTYKHVWRDLWMKTMIFHVLFI